MAGVKIDHFHGIYPRIHPSLLGDGMAVAAHNCRLKNGKLVPLRMSSKMLDSQILLEGDINGISEAKSLIMWKHRGNIEFVAFKGVVDKADGDVADDEYDRMFLTGDTRFSWNGHDDVPVVYLREGVPGGGSRVARIPLPKESLPAPKAKLVTDSGAPSDPDNVRYTYFFQTWVDPYGYESGVSEPSLNWHPDATSIGGGKYTKDDLEYNDGDLISIAELTDSEVPEGGGTVNNPTPGFKRRIYKVVSGSESGSVKFVAEFADDPWTAKSVKVKDEDVGETMPTMESAPPDLVNMIYVPGGFYVGFSKSHPKTVMFSDVGIPTSWPLAYRYDLRDNIVALAVSTNTVFALTDGFPCVLSGTAPESMTVSMLAGPAACVSKRSVCLYKDAVCYASNVGVCMISASAGVGTTVNNLTEKIFTKEQWQAYGPRNCLMAQYDGALFCFFGRESEGGLVIDLQESENAVTTHDEKSSCLCVDYATDELYFVREVDGSGV